MGQLRHRVRKCGLGVHTNTDPLAGSNLPTLETGFKRLRIQRRNPPGSCRREAVPTTFLSGFRQSRFRVDRS